MERKFAVVRWSEGEDAGKLSEVKTDTIRSYDDSKMDQQGNPIGTYSAVIEWRHGKKQRGGWPHYRGTVVFVCANRFEATRKLNLLLKEDDPAVLTKRVSAPPKKYQDDSDDSTDTETQILTQSSQVKKPSALTIKDPAEEFLEMYSCTQPSANDKSPRNTVVELKRKIKDLQEENAKLKELVVQDMKHVIELAAPPKRSKLEPTTPPLPIHNSPQSRHSSSAVSSLRSLPRSTPPSDTSDTDFLSDSKSSMVEIHPGTGVMVEKLAWTYAMNANSATIFVRHLLTAVFPVETLLVSNLRGGKRGGVDARQPLDKKKLDAIYSATLQKWPGTQLSSIGSTINAKITELRAKSKMLLHPQHLLL
ncbi:hypothetical protein WMY93_023068 [Mugilogobius chulae]|uniref:BEN domain-containing protein n=1 Tax=Mugilogobius chulae TaxID=88201 RepID=A0AAW0NEA6_9GOBI